MYYILEGHKPVPEYDLLKWAWWMQEADRTVKKTVIDEPKVRITISTVFLGINHQRGRDGEPLLFETLILGGEHDGEMRRYATWYNAEACLSADMAGHDEMVAMLRGVAHGSNE